MKNYYTVVLMSASEVLYEKEFQTFVDAFDFYIKIELDPKTNVCKVVRDNEHDRYSVKNSTDMFDALTTCSTDMIKRLQENGHNKYLSIYKLPLKDMVLYTCMKEKGGKQNEKN